MIYTQHNSNKETKTRESLQWEQKAEYSETLNTKQAPHLESLCCDKRACLIMGGGLQVVSMGPQCDLEVWPEITV